MEDDDLTNLDEVKAAFDEGFQEDPDEEENRLIFQKFEVEGENGDLLPEEM